MERRKLNADEIGAELIGLEWEDACLTPETDHAVRTASNWQVRKPLHQRSSGRWRNYAGQLEGVRQRLADAGLLKDCD